MRFLDTNVLLRYLTGEDADKAEQALSLLLRIERGEEKVMTSPLVIFETIYTLQKTYKIPRQKISDLMLPIIFSRGLQLVDKEVYPRAFDLYTTKNISFGDAYNAAYMLIEEIRDIYSWDTDFDKIDDITRIEP